MTGWRIKRGSSKTFLVFDDATGRVIDLDLHGSKAETRFPCTPEAPPVGCRVRPVFRSTLILIARAPLARAQTIIAQKAAGPVRFDGPWVLYPGDAPDTPLASAKAEGRKSLTLILVETLAEPARINLQRMILPTT